MDTLIRNSVRTAAALTIIITAALSISGRFLWAAGFLTGCAWSIINFLLTTDILKSVFIKKKKAGIFFALFIKFPLLYLVLLLIFISKVFAPLSILAGIPVILVTIGVFSLCRKQA